MNKEQVSQILQATPETVRSLLQGVDPTLHTWRPEADEWSINEIIGHLIECDHHCFSERIRLMLAEEEPEIPAVDVNTLAAQRSDNEESAFVLLDALAEQRITRINYLLSLSDEQMARTGHFKKHGVFRVSDFVYEWAYHDCDHIQQILENVKSAAWPQLSPTMQKALRS